ncbi:MAG: protein kinase domain-containing protein, partial [Gemmatimonadaceae bacterium]
MTVEFREHLQSVLGAGYVLDRELGGGGMSRVFVATETALGRSVVVKVLPPELSSEVSAERFKREIRLVAQLRHPHIVPVHAAGEAGGLLYYTMPFVEGESLRVRLERGGELPVVDAVRLIRDVADALSYAHARGVVHRDLRPDNILLEHAHAAIADFGIAKALEAATQPAGGRGTTLTTVGMAVGTPAYMAPEQAAGDPHADPRSDLYALGVIAYEVLTGSHPFAGRSAQAVIAAHATQSPEPITIRRPGVPATLAALVMRLLEKRPADRPQSADEVLRALDAVAHAETDGGHTAAPRRGARRLVYAGGAALAIAALVGSVLLSRSRAHDGEPGARKMIAVLPFKNLGGAEDAYFADGVTEEVTTRLASLSALGVISRTSADQYRDTTKPLKQIAKELGVGYVLEGSVRWEKTADGRGKVRVTPQLIRVSDDSHVWGERLDADVSDVFQVQGTIAERVAEALDVALGAPQRRTLAARPTKSPEAYDFYLRGAERLRQGNSPQLAEAVRLLRRAVALDPTFALAYARLSEAQAGMYYAGIDRSLTQLELMWAAARRSVELAPDLAEAHHALGFAYYNRSDLDRAEAEWRRAAELAPGSAEAWYWVGWGRLNRSDTVSLGEAVRYLERAAALDPRDPQTYFRLSSANQLLRRYPDALRFADRAIAVASDDPVAYTQKAIMVARLGGDRAGAREVLLEAIHRFGLARVASDGLFDPSNFEGDTATLAALIRLRPSNFEGDTVGYLVRRGDAYRLRGDSALARASYDSARVRLAARARALASDGWILAQLALINARLGHRATAIDDARRATTLSAESRADSSWVREVVARAYAQAGDASAAIAMLDSLLAVPSWTSAPQLRTDPDFAPLRSDPRFQR